MPEIRHNSGLRVTTETFPEGGCKTGRTWDTIVKSCIKSGELYLGMDEVVAGIEIDPEYGLMFLLEKLPRKEPLSEREPREPDGLMSRAYQTLIKSAHGY